MGVFGNIITSAKNNILGNNSSPNQLVEERQIRQPNIQSLYNNNSLVDDYYEKDEDGNGVPDALEVKHHKYMGDGIPREDKLKPFSFKKPRKDYNQSFDHKGRYVATVTYPLPPVKHEKDMFERNRAINNQNNDFLFNSRMIPKPEIVDGKLKKYQMEKMKQINGRLYLKPKSKSKPKPKELQNNQFKIKFF